MGNTTKRVLYSQFLSFIFASLSIKTFFMKQIFVLYLFLNLWLGTSAQIVPVRQVVSTGGTDTLINRIIWASTVGEAVISTFTAGSLVLTQGFQQPDGFSITPFFPYIQNLVIYPNPGRPNTQLRFYLKADNTPITVKIFDANGKLYQEQKLVSYAGQTWHSLNPQIMSAG